MKRLFYEMQEHKMCNENMHICNKTLRICNVRYSRQVPDGPWRTSVNTDTKEKTVVNLSMMDRLIWKNFLYWEKSIEYHEIESAFHSEKEKEVMMCEHPV